MIHGPMSYPLGAIHGPMSYPLGGIHGPNSYPLGGRIGHSLAEYAQHGLISQPRDAQRA